MFKYSRGSSGVLLNPRRKSRVGILGHPAPFQGVSGVV